MANSYMNFVLSIEIWTVEEANWIQDTLADLEKLVSVDFETDEEHAKLLEKLGELGKKAKSWEDGGLLEFEYHLIDTDDDADEVAELRIHSDENGSPEQVADFLQAFAKKFRPGEVFWFSWAITCDKDRINEFTGGAVVVTAETIEVMDAQNWALARAKKLRTSKKDFEGSNNLA